MDVSEDEILAMAENFAGGIQGGPTELYSGN